MWAGAGCRRAGLWRSWQPGRRERCTLRRALQALRREMLPVGAQLLIEYDLPTSKVIERLSD
jgi:hypothetical protein